MTATNVEIVTPQNDILIDSPENVVEIARNDVEVVIVETIGPQIATGGSAGTVILRLIAGEALTKGDVISVATNGEAIVANAGTATGRQIVVGLTTASFAMGEEATIQVVGRADSLFAVPPGAADNGKEVFLSLTSGLVTLTPPTAAGTTLIRVGVLLTGDGASLTPAIDIAIETRADIP